MRRRGFLAALPAWIAGFARADRDGAPRAAPIAPLVFPRDRGAHPAFRTEWWYATGHLESDDGPLGFQVTFFRLRRAADLAITSRFAARQIVVAHAALALPREGRLVAAEKIARAGVGDVALGEDETELRIGHFAFAYDRPARVYRAAIDAASATTPFHLALTLTPTQPALLHGEGGISRKDSDPDLASAYYSEPQLAVAGSVELRNRERAVRGTGWIDHEWSERVLSEAAAGWDWVGVNLDDGSALMAFRIRARENGTVRWAAATLRSRDGATRTFAPGEVGFETLRAWTSPRTGAHYPVSFRIRAGEFEWTLAPLFDDQEEDARATTGIVYWEGAVIAQREGRAIGRGYLELTGYVSPVVL